MLTHEIIVKKPVEQPKVYHKSRKLNRDEKRCKNRLKNDLKCQRVKVGDTVYINDYGYGKVMEIISDYDQITEWEGTAPMNVLVWIYDEQTEYFFNVLDLHKA